MTVDLENPMQGKEIVVEPSTSVVNMQNYLPFGEEASMIEKWANFVSTSPYYTKSGGKAGIISIWLAARELGIPLMGALNGGMYYVQGQVVLSARMMNTMIRKRGHSIQKIEGTALVCHLKGKRKDNGDVSESIFTIEQANKAGLTKNPVWKTYPERMLFNRALSGLAKDLFADCIGSAYIEGEIEEAEFDVVEAEDKGIDKETAVFIDKHNLLDENNELSKFIDRIADTLSKKRIEVISDAAKNEEKFLKSFENHTKNKIKTEKEVK